MLKYYKEDPNACDLVKYHDTDIGYDLTIIKECDKYGKTTLYDTGIIIEPPRGYHTKVYARSSLVKTGYILTNSVGLIDETYRGSIKIALTKVDDTMEDIKLPFRCAQLVVEKSENIQTMQVFNKSILSTTERNMGGFGSTNNYELFSKHFNKKPEILTEKFNYLVVEGNRPIPPEKDDYTGGSISYFENFVKCDKIIVNGK